MNTLAHQRSIRAQSAPVLQLRLREWAGALAGTLRLWAHRERSRRELRELDEHLLRDIGVSRGEADFIGNKPFWRE